MIVLSSLKYVAEIALLIFLIVGCFIGWKRGFITSLVSFIFTICIFVGAFYLKNFLSIFMYENLPFINYGGIFEGITALNILIYEAAAFVICIIALIIIAVIITKVTNLVNKLVNATVILALPNKILGLILTLVQFFIIGFFVLFVMIQIPYTNYVFDLNNSVIANTVVEKTPGLSLITNKYYNTYKEVYQIIDKHSEVVQGEEEIHQKQANYETLDTLMKNKVITVDSVKKLKEKNKLNIDNIDELINKYNK
ncbi:MAG: CvpA family protein [Bacilli bacterium]|nr:CvpA family protein [Bacilli bacterium]